MTALRDLTGRRFGKLIIVARAPSDPHGNTFWRALCDCGAESIAMAGNLMRGATRSCGCGIARTTHGQTGGRHGKKTGAYASWVSMVSRCTNPNSDKYDRYGGRGITVCERWLVFENFFADMGERSRGLSIERIDNEKGYEPDNCKWATTQEQSRNKRSSVVSLDDVQEIIGRFEHGEKQASIGRRFGIGVSYIGKIIWGKVWPEIDRPYLQRSPCP